MTSSPTTLITQGQALSTDVLHQADTLSAAGRSKMIFEGSSALDEAREALTSECTVVVAGEAKRAKSSWLNGLIGKNLLPTGADITTCQAFSVRNTDTPRYGLRFEDDSFEEIAEEDLQRYGSQMVLDRGEAPSLSDLGKMLRWIEVETPCSFLPRGVRFIDTPGMGSVYAEHGEVTQRFVPRAHGLVFVLTSEIEVVADEIRFLDEILKITPYVFFIQTRIDTQDTAAWQEVLARNEEILRKHFSDRLALPVKVWPVSNTCVLKAAQLAPEKQARWLDAARFPEMMAALELFLFHVGTWSRCRPLTEASLAYYNTGLRMLNHRHEAACKSVKEQAGILKSRQEQLDLLDKKFGPNGADRIPLRRVIQELCDCATRQMAQDIALNGTIYADFKKKIADASADKLKQYAESLGAEVAAAVAGRFQAIEKNLQEDLNQMHECFVQSTAGFTDWEPFMGTDNVGLKKPNTPDLLERLAVLTWKMPLEGGLAATLVSTGVVTASAIASAAAAATGIGGTISGIAVGTATGGGAATAAVATASAVAAAPVMLFVGAATVVYCGWRIYKRQRAAKVEAERGALMKYLSELLINLRSNMFDIDMTQGKKISVVDASMQSLGLASEQRIEKYYQGKRRELEHEIENLRQQQKADDPRQAAKTAQEELTFWRAFQQPLLDCKKRVDALDAQLQNYSQSFVPCRDAVPA